jgi:hypothetical protein
MYNDYKQLPSIMAERPHIKTSSKYSFVPTYKVINLLETNGWDVSDCRESNARENKRGFQKHLIRFRRKGDTQRHLELNELIPEIALTNSHDGGSSFQLSSALYRCFCSNQCTVSDTTVSSHRVLHKGYNRDQILDAAYTIVKDTPKVFDKVNRFKSIQLSEPQQEIFADSALDLVFDSEKWDKYDKKNTKTRLLEPRRSEDRDKNLWNTYNVIQEKFLQGGRYLIEKNNYNNYKYSTGRKTKRIKSIDKDIRLNKALWSLTERMSELVKVTR